MTSRLVLNLKLITRPPVDETVATLSTALHTSYIVGGLGAPLQNEQEAIIADMHHYTSSYEDEDIELMSPW